MALPFKGNPRKMVILGCKILKKRRTRRKKLEIAEYSKSLLEFHLSGGFAFWNFQEKRNGILAILVQKPENPLET